MKLQAGHRYVRRDGKITGPLARVASTTTPFRDNQTSFCYLPSGRISEKYEYPQDLIKEYVL